MRDIILIFRRRYVLLAVALGCSAAGCMVGPTYQPPRALTQTTPSAYKESTTQPGDPNAWKPAQPRDAMLRGKWWKVFEDQELNDLEDQLNINNQNIKLFFENLMVARALIGEARSQLYPTVTVNPLYSRSRSPNISGTSIAGTGTGTGTGTTVTGATSSGSNHVNTLIQLPVDVTWEPDLWGKVRNAINQATYNTQLSAADLENERLTEQATLAATYFEIRGQDAVQKTFNDTIAADKKQLDYTEAQYDTGIGTQISVVQAETTLQSVEAQATGVGVARAQFEHAIAVLVGKNPSQFSIPVRPSLDKPPSIPIGVPSQLLERRPDIAAAERAMAAANAQIGIGVAAYYPDLTLSASGGFESSAFDKLLDWPNRFWAVGPSLSYTVFDAGLRRATVNQYVATYNGDVDTYRQTVLTAFQQVEDNLAALRILSQQTGQQAQAVQSAQKSLQLELDRYDTGIDPYLDVVIAQTTLLSNQQTLLTVQIQEMTSAVQLIAALGGGWDRTQLPTTRQVSDWSSHGDEAIQR